MGLWNLHGLLKTCTHKLNVHIALVFITMLKHGVVPNGFKVFTIIPITRGKRKSMNCYESYKGIALSSILGKVLMQSHPTSKLNKLYCNNTTPINAGGCCALLLDASKGFGTVIYVKLFELLSSKGLCPMVVRFLAIFFF